MKSKPIVLLSIWGISVTSAFLAGKTLTSRTKAGENNLQNTKSTSTNLNQQQKALESNGNSTASLASAQARLAASSIIKQGSTPEQMVTDIARSEDAIARNTALLALIDSLSPENYLSVVDAFRKLGLTSERRGEYELLLTAWAKVDPAGALDYASENTGGEYARNTILSTWATTNPDAAIAWAEENHTNADRANPWMVGVIEGIALSDVPRATGLMEGMIRSDERGQALDFIVDHLIANDPEEAKAWSTSVTNEGLRSSAFAFTATALARDTPSEAAQWLSSVGDVAALNRASEGITEDWYKESPEETTAWISSLPPEAMSKAAEGVVGNVVREDPVQAAEYISELAASNPDANFDSSIRELVRGSARQDPELAAVWVSGISNDNEQTRYYHRVLGQWANQDSAAANAWMLSNSDSLPDSIARRFLQDQGQN